MVPPSFARGGRMMKFRPGSNVTLLGLGFGHRDGLGAPPDGETYAAPLANRPAEIGFLRPQRLRNSGRSPGARIGSPPRSAAEATAAFRAPDRLLNSAATWIGLSMNHLRDIWRQSANKPI
jgi:hypothetical protein